MIETGIEAVTEIESETGVTVMAACDGDECVCNVCVQAEATRAVAATKCRQLQW